MTDFASMTDEQLNRAAAEVMGHSMGVPASSLDDLKRLADTLGIGVEVEISNPNRDDMRAMAWPKSDPRDVCAYNDPVPARAGLIALLMVLEKRKE